MKIDLKKYHVVLIIAAYSLFFVLLIHYLLSQQLASLLMTVLSLFIAVLLHALLQFKYYILHFIFILTIFIFLVSRPTIDYIKTGLFVTYQRDAYVFAFTVVIISLIGLMVGGSLMRVLLPFLRLQQPKKRQPMINVLQVQKVAFISFCITYPFYVLRLLERLSYRLQTNYYEYYASFESKLPYITYLLSSFMIYALCVYLATNPRKKMATAVLIAYTLANGIHLLIGTRNPFILSLLFALVYYYIRQQEQQETWLGKKEKFALYAGTPLLMLAMGMLNYLRDAIKVAQTTVFDLLIDFVYKQGTSFGVLARGYLYQSNLPVKPFTNFTFGPMIEYFTHGSLGILFGGKAFATTANSLEMALESNSYSHNISYIVLKEDYLAGHGIGGSYIMDIFTDYGYVGLFIMNCLLGGLFILMLHALYRKKLLLSTMSLMILMNLFFMPRSSFSESFFPLITMQFWFIVIAIIVFAQWTKKRRTL